MRKLKFVFGVHCHQPVGNFESVFSDTYERAYLPFVKILAKYPRLKFVVYYSGVLYDWFEQNHPEFIELLDELARKGQLEILSGGYYEPILSLIPDQDKIGQIEMANQYIKETFGRAPQGMWLTERVWEPQLPKILSKAGIEYTLVDDDHFIQVGVKLNKLFGYYLTEEEGEIVKLLPLNRKLREFIPFRPSHEIIDYLKSIPNPDGNAVVIFMDNGEKFGLCQDGYLGKLLIALEENSDWLESTTISGYLEEYPPLGRIYLPSISYVELQRWAAGYFKNFLVRYPESNRMHKKMLHVSSRLQTLSQGKSLIGGQEKAANLRIARRELYQGQCHGAYWPGLSGGINLNYLRHAVYSHLIRAENELDRFNRGSGPFVELAITDFDKDGRDEVILSNNLLNLYFSPGRGGSLFELDYKPKAFNLLDTLARPQRFSLVDHFLLPETTLSAFSYAKHVPAGDFNLKPYAYMPKRNENEIVLRLARDGIVDGVPVRLEKSISLFARQFIVLVEYEITNLGGEPDEFWFGSEFNFSLLAGYTPDCYYEVAGHDLGHKVLASRGELEKVSQLKLVDERNGFDVSLELNKPALLWRFPTENDFGYQSSGLLPSWKFKLGSQESWQVKISLRIEE